MRRPKYGWSDVVCRVVAAASMIIGAVGLWPYPGSDRAMANVALGVALLALSGVERLRQDARNERSAALRGDQP